MSSSGDIPSFEPFTKKKGIAVLDGGMTTSLPPGSGTHFMWGKQLLFTKKGLEDVYKVHYDFLEAGADAIELKLSCPHKGKVAQFSESASLAKST